MAGRFGNPTPQFLDDNGVPLAGGKLNFYLTGTTTRQNTYSDDALTVANDNPVILDSAGRAPNIFASSDQPYKVVLTDANDVVIWTRDPVTFVDLTDLLAAIDALEAEIAALTGYGITENPVRNPSAVLVSAASGVTLTGSFQSANVLGWLGRVTGTVSAGEFTASSQGFGSCRKQAKMSGVTGDSTSVMEFAVRINSVDAAQFVSGTASASAVVYHDTGAAVNWTVQVYKANAVDDFSGVTSIGSNYTSVANASATTISVEGISMGDCSNGIEIRIKSAPATTFSTKNFYATDVQIARSSVIAGFSSKPVYHEMSIMDDYGFYTESGSGNTYTLTATQYSAPQIAYHDGMQVRFVASHTNTSACTINANGLGAKDWVSNRGIAMAANVVISGKEYQCTYRASDGKFHTSADEDVVITFASAGTFTWPSGLTALSLTACGGGGGGGDGSYGGKGGDGAAVIIDYTFSGTAGSAYTITIGTGGAGSTGSGTGSSGVSTGCFGLTLAGGAGGTGSGTATARVGFAAGSEAGDPKSDNLYRFGPLGYGGSAGGSGAAGGTGVGYGSGGGGGGTSGGNGGHGAPGVVILKWVQ